MSAEPTTLWDIARLFLKLGTTAFGGPADAWVAAQDYLRPAAVKAGAIDSDYRGRFG